MSKNKDINLKTPLDSTSFAPVLAGEGGAPPKGASPFPPPQQYHYCGPLVAPQDYSLHPAEIEALASRVLRLTVSHRDPERFFIDRSDIAGEMRRLARRMR